jgi:acyl-CoA synthetase (AMP-forming)/AMP-acid ligase II
LAENMHPLTVLPPPGSSPGRTLGALLAFRATEHPAARPYPGLHLTYAQLHHRAGAVAARLGAVALPGSRVLLAHPEGAGFAAALFGTVLAGMVAVPVPEAGNGSGGVVRAQRAAVDCAPEVLLTPPSWAYELGDVGAVRVVVADEYHVDGEPVTRLAARWRPIGVMPGAPAYLRYAPDGPHDAEFTHEDVLVTLLLLARTARLGLDERHIEWLAGIHGLESAWRSLLPVYLGADEKQ